MQMIRMTAIAIQPPKATRVAMLLILSYDEHIDIIQSRPVMLFITVVDSVLIVSHKRSITFFRVENSSFLKPRFRISFQICSIEFISGVYGGIINI